MTTIFKKGDKVFFIGNEYILKHSPHNKTYPIRIRFSDTSYLSFTECGRCLEGGDVLLSHTKTTKSWICDKCGLDFSDIECRHYCADCADELPKNNPDEDICCTCMDRAE